MQIFREVELSLRFPNQISVNADDRLLRVAKHSDSFLGSAARRQALLA
jgi:hypothetical protein